MRALVLLLPLVLVLAAPAAARDKPDPSIADGSAQRKLDRARERWHKAGIHNYRFALQPGCSGCGWDDVTTPTFDGVPVFFVRNDRPVKVPAQWRPYATVKRLQQIVQKAIHEDPASLSVRYDKRGIPLRIAIDPVPDQIDDEATHEIKRFW